MTLRHHRSVAWTTLATLSIGLVISACAAVGTSGPSTPLEASASATAISTVATTVEPTTTAPSPPAIQSDPPIPLPPDASLAVDGGDPVVGALGTFTWQNGGSDSPWLPGTPMHTGAGEVLTLTLADGVGIDTWTVKRSAPATLGKDVAGMADGTGEPLTFDAPPPGTWSVYVDVRFADGLGTAAYFWLITVD